MKLFENKTELALIDVINRQNKTITKLHQIIADITASNVDFTEREENGIIEIKDDKEFFDDLDVEQIKELKLDDENK